MTRVLKLIALIGLISIFMLGCSRPEAIYGYTGRHYFTQARVVYVKPDIDSTRVLTKTKVSFTFSSPVRLMMNSFNMYCTTHRQFVYGDLSLDSDGLTYTFCPKERLHPFEQYICTVASVQDMEGKPTLSMTWAISVGAHEREVRYIHSYPGSWIVYETTTPGLRNPR